MPMDMAGHIIIGSGDLGTGTAGGEPIGSLTDLGRIDCPPAVWPYPTPFRYGDVTKKMSLPGNYATLKGRIDARWPPDEIMKISQVRNPT